MAQFEVRIHRLKIEEHPDADRLEIARVLGYTCVVPRGMYKTGDLAAYIPEQAIVPDAILAEMGLEGRLAGAQKNRVRAQRLRGILSQGLVYGGKLLEGRQWNDGEPCTGLLGITKWEPPIPPEMDGKLERYAGGDGRLYSYDVESIKNYTDRFKEGEQCVMHEKVHGTLCYFVVDAHGTITVSSKGRASQQLVFAAKDVDNIYTRMRDRYADDLRALAQDLVGCSGTVHILCEAYGSRVQDLAYGTQLDMAVFDVLLPAPEYAYVPQSDIFSALDGAGLRPVPLAYEGPFSYYTLDKHTSGPSLVPGAGHLREGVVVRPVPEREDADGRVVLKSVSPDYLCRTGGTEYN